MPTVAGTARALRGRPLGRGLILVAVIVAAFVFSRGCQRSFVRITKDQAVGLGQRRIDFRPQGHTVRMVLRGVPPRRYWAVSYWIRSDRQGGGYRKITVVLIDANTGKVFNVIKDRS